MTRHRAQRVADLMQRELAQIFLEKLKDPRAAMATVSDVSLSPDLGFARIKVSAFGSDSERKACLDAVRHAGGFVRSQLAQRLALRVVPELRFELDRGPEHSQRINELLADLPELTREDTAVSPTEPGEAEDDPEDDHDR
ncbi:MAG TPA: 30S ribosome-binding factor RbfA [Thermoanaerobaculia bacterium]|nr:30S ribosome-binding factor RbfA [Thermoanaerobaculia bacterium]